jgi:hypothetical protein
VENLEKQGLQACTHEEVLAILGMKTLDFTWKPELRMNDS